MKKTVIFAALAFALELSPNDIGRVYAREPIPTPQPLSGEALARKIEELRTIPVKGYAYSDAIWYIRKAGQSKNREYAGALKAIATAQSERKTDVTELPFHALYSLWLLGEPKAYFLDNARAYEDNIMLAYYSILILAYDPIPEVTEKLPTEIIDNEPGPLVLTPAVKERIKKTNLINGSLGVYKMMNQTSQAYNSTTDLERKLAILMPGIRNGWRPSRVGREEFDISTSLAPLAVWARTRLWKLSQEQPAEVARAITTVRFRIEGSPDIESRDDVQDSFRNYLSRLLGDEAKREYGEVP